MNASKIVKVSFLTLLAVGCGFVFGQIDGSRQVDRERKIFEFVQESQSKPMRISKATTRGRNLGLSETWSREEDKVKWVYFQEKPPFALSYSLVTVRFRESDGFVSDGEFFISNSAL